MEGNSGLIASSGDVAEVGTNVPSSQSSVVGLKVDSSSRNSTVLAYASQQQHQPYQLPLSIPPYFTPAFPISQPNPPPDLEILNASTPSKIIMDGVYLNGIHALRRIELRNNSAHHLCIRLRSSLGSQIAYQLTNENLPDIHSPHQNSTSLLSKDLTGSEIESATSLNSSNAEGYVSAEMSKRDQSDLFPSAASMQTTCSTVETSRNSETYTSFMAAQPLPESSVNMSTPPPNRPNTLSPSALTTNTVQAAGLRFSGEESMLYGHQVNQLFNYVNHIDEIHMSPKQVQSLILAFLPAPTDEKSGNTSSMIGQQHNSPLEDQDYNFIEVNGMLFFFAYIEDSLESSLVVDFRANASISRKASISIPLLLESGNSKTENAENISSTIAASSGSPPDYQLIVKFRSRVCKSILWSDDSDSGILLEDCVVGGTYYKDFTIWNRSEIDLFWSLNSASTIGGLDASWVSFSNYETGDALDGKPIPAYSPFRIRITYRPKEVGEFSYDFQIENANDSSNTVQILMHAVVTSTMREECIVLSCGNTLDFGDCCAGTWSKQDFIVKNVSEVNLDIRLSSDVAGSQIMFLQSDEIPNNQFSGMARIPARSASVLSTTPSFLRVHSTGNSTVNSSVSSRALSPIDPDAQSVIGSDSIDLLRDSLSSGLSSYPEELTPFQSSVPIRSPDKSFEDFNRVIEDLQLRPGAEKTVEIYYRHELEPSTTDYRAGRFSKRNFKICLQYDIDGLRTERKNLQCKAKVATSFIEVLPSEIAFGNIDVGTLVSKSLGIRNCSDIAAKVEIKFSSKVLSCVRGVLTIPPRQRIEVKLEMFPRKVNHEYHKQITVVNCLNESNDQVVEVTSSNIDQQRVTFHALFYRISTASGSSILDYGSVILNHSAVRSFNITNISKHRLVLELSSLIPDELTFFKRGSQSYSLKAISYNKSKREKLLLSFGEKNPPQVGPSSEGQDKSSSGAINASTVALLSRAKSVPKISGGNSISDYLDLASPSRSFNLSQKDGKRVPAFGRRAITTAQRHLGAPAFKPRNITSETSSLSTSISGRIIQPPAELSSVVPSGANIDTAPRLSNVTSPFETVLHSPTETGIAEANKLAEYLEIGTLDSVLLGFESLGAALPAFPKSAVEESYVSSFIGLHTELQNCIQNKDLVSASVIEIPPGSELLIVAILNVAHINKEYLSTKPRKYDSRILIKLVDFDRKIENSQFTSLLADIAQQGDTSPIPVRELLIRSSLSKSLMEIGQKNINFGTLEKNEQISKTITIRNQSECPLLYRIKKSGSIASSDLTIRESKVGVVRGYSKKDVVFFFEPSMHGLFHEKLIVENIQDADNVQVISVKATVKRRENILVKVDSLDFGPMILDSNASRSFIVTNTSAKQTLLFEIQYQPSPMHSAGAWYEIVEFEVDDVQMGNAAVAGHAVVTKEMEEEIEHLEQKLKIAIRKGRDGKAKTIAEKITKLKAGLTTDGYEEEGMEVIADPSNTASFSDNRSLVALDESGSNLKRPTSAPPFNLGFPGSQKTKRSENSIVFPVPPKGVKIISVTLRLKSLSYDEPSDTQGAISSDMLVNGQLIVHEHKNTDFIKKVDVHATIFGGRSDFDSAVRSPFPHEILAENRTLLNINTSKMPSEMKPLEFPEPKVDRFIANQITCPIPPVHALEIETSQIDLGRLEINVLKEMYFTLVNITDNVVEFGVNCHARVTMNPDFLSPLNPLETRRIYLSMIPDILGNQIITLEVVEVGTGLVYLVQFTFYVISSEYVRFVGLNAPELSLGYCFLDPSKKYAKVFHVEVENISEQAVVFQVTSNLQQQCLVYVDEALEVLANRIVLGSSERCFIYVALQPYFLGNKKSASESAQGSPVNILENRKLIGGIKLALSNADDNFFLMTQSIKFEAIIGQSSFTVSHSVLDLGTAEAIGEELKSGFWVYNSSYMPLDVDLVADSPDIQLGTTKIHLLRSESSSLADPMDVKLHRHWVDVAVTCNHYGLFHRRIQIVNVNNSDSSFEVLVRYFMDPCVIISSCHSLLWPSVYSFRLSDGSLALRPSKPLQFSMTNSSSSSLLLSSFSNLNIRILAKGLETQSDSSPSSAIKAALPDLYGDNWLALGETVLLSPFQTIEMIIELSDMAGFLSHSLLMQSIRGELLFFDGESRCVGVMPIGVEYCMSQISLEPPEGISLGRIGIDTSWDPLTFQVTIKNDSEIESEYMLKLPEGVVLISGASMIRDRYVLREKEIATLAFSFDPVIPLTSSESIGGESMSLIELINVHTEAISAFPLSWTMTVFDVRLAGDYLVGDVMTLPPFDYPPLQKSDMNASINHTTILVQNNSEVEVLAESSVLINELMIPFVKVKVANSSQALDSNVLCILPRESVVLNIEVSVLPPCLDFFEKISLSGSGASAYSWLFDPLGVSLAYLSLTSPKHRVLWNSPRIEIRGKFLEVGIIACSTNKLEFMSFSSSNSSHNVISPACASFSLRNLSAILPAYYQITLDCPMELSISKRPVITPLDEGMRGSIPPGSTSSLYIEWKDLEIAGLSQDIVIHIQDLCSFSGAEVTLAVSVLEREGNREVIGANMNQQNLTTIENAAKFGMLSGMYTAEIDMQTKSSLSLRGCKKISLLSDMDSLYELDLGSLDLNAMAPMKRLILENVGLSKETYYTVRSLSHMDLHWISASVTSERGGNVVADEPSNLLGVFESESGDADPDASFSTLLRPRIIIPGQVETIQFSFNTSQRRSHFTYLIIQNMFDLADTKYVIVKMDILGAPPSSTSFTTLLSSNPSIDGSYELLVSPIHNSLQVNYHATTSGLIYPGRRLLIRNRESTHQEFVLKPNRSTDSDSIVLFSTNRNGNLLQRSVVVPPFSQLLVYLIYLPELRKAPLNLEQSTASSLSESREVQANQVHLPGVFFDSIDVQVHSRLVKDLQSTLTLTAIITEPQIYFDTLEAHWKGQLIGVPSMNDYKFKLLGDPATHTTNFFADVKEHGLLLSIVNDVTFFAIKGCSTADGGYRLSVTPDIDAILGNAEYLMKEKYITEHIFVYNSWNPSEKYMLTFSLSLGPLTLAHVSFSRPVYMAFESKVISFLLQDLSGKALEYCQSGRPIRNDESLIYTSILDEFIYQGSLDHGNHSYVRLAALFFSELIFRATCKSADVEMAGLISDLKMLLEYIPCPDAPVLAPLIELYHTHHHQHNSGVNAVITSPAVGASSVYMDTTSVAIANMPSSLQ